MPLGHLAAGGAQQGKSVVLQLAGGRMGCVGCRLEVAQIPIVGTCHAEGFDEVAHKPATEICNVDPLVEQFATTRQISIAPPLLVVTWPPSVAVDGTDE